jgi:hypothetical protein
MMTSRFRVALIIPRRALQSGGVAAYGIRGVVGGRGRARTRRRIRSRVELNVGPGGKGAQRLDPRSDEAEMLCQRAGSYFGRGGEIAPGCPSARLVVLGFPSEGVMRHARTIG